MHFSAASGIFAIPQLAIVLGVMVLVHEFGHFAVAKLCGVRVETFAIGFGKRLFGVVRNGTDYCVNLIPLGGYVKMAGVGDEPISGSEQRVASKDPGELQNHPRWQRTLITLAGPIANFILAFALLTGLFASHNEVPAYRNQPVTADYVTANSPIGRTGIQPGDRILRFDRWDNPTWDDITVYAGNEPGKTEPFSFLHQGHRVDTTLTVDTKDKPQDFDFAHLGLVPVQQDAPLQVASLTAQDTPAARAGLQPGDRILSADGKAFHSVQALAAYLEDQGGRPLQLQVGRNAQTLALTAIPVIMDTPEGKAYKLGFNNVQPPTRLQRMPFAKAAQESWDVNLKSSKLVFVIIGRLFTREVSVKSLSSPIGIGVQVHQAFNEGPSTVIGTMAMISLQLGIFNLLPFPILDGGMIVFLFVESLMRRDINQQLKERIYQVAFVCLILFAAVVIFNDVTKMLPTHIRT